MKKNVAVDVKSISKKYASSSIGVKSIFLNLFKKKVSEIDINDWVLENVSFQVEKGNAFCIAGPNGTGKSTLLSLIQGIIKPDFGEIYTNGKLIAMNELGGGFHPDLTGRDNVFVNGAILGNSHFEIKKNFKKIIEFSGIEKFIDKPLRTYSNGMIARLAFSIMVYTQASIILIDEVLAVGDQEFRNKCIAHFENFKKKGGTIILVTHDLGILKTFCDKGVYISENFVSEILDAENLIKEYFEDN